MVGGRVARRVRAADGYAKDADLEAADVRKQSCLAFLAAIVVAVLASGCGDKGGRNEVLTATDVRKAFEHQGLRLEAYEVGPGIPALRYPVGAKGDAMRIACLVFGDSVIARGYVKTIRKKRPGTVSRALRAKNVAVLILPAATTDDVQRTLNAVAELRR